eukprot:15288549-Alexandrium_andersonii.AAC.1
MFWPLARAKSKGIARIADWRLADRSSLLRDFATSDPVRERFRRRIRNLREKQRRTHPSGASGTDFEAVPGSAQFQ